MESYLDDGGSYEFAQRVGNTGMDLQCIQSDMNKLVSDLQPGTWRSGHKYQDTG